MVWKKPGATNLNQRIGGGAWSADGHVFAIDAGAASFAGHRHVAGEGHVRHARNRRESIEHVALQAQDALGIGDLRLRDGDAHQLHVARVGEARRHGSQREKRPDHQPRPHEQNRVRARPEPRPGRCRARLRSRLSLEPRPPARSVRARRLPPNLATGMLPKRSADDSESAQRKDQHRRIERDLAQAGNAGGSDASTTRCRPADASRSPRAPPSRPSTRLSTSSCRARRPRPAPSAARMASS